MSFGKDIIAGILQDEITIEDLYHKIGIMPEHFSDDHSRYFYQVMIGLVDRGLECNQDTVSDYILTHERNKIGTSTYLSILDNLAEKDLDSFNYALDKIEQRKDNYNVQALLKKAVEVYESTSSPEEVYQTLALGLKKKTSNIEYMLRELTGASAYDERQSARTAAKENIRSLKMIGRFSCLQKYFPDGLVKETVTAIAGQTNVGKSLFLQNICEIAIKPENGLSGLLVVAENRLKMAEDRQDAINLNVPYSEVKHGRNDEESARNYYKLLEHNGGGNLFVVKMPTGDFNAHDLANVVDRVLLSGIKLDFIAIDSPDHMKPLNSSNQAWINKGQVYLDLKNMTELYRLICITTLPMKAGSSGKKSVSAEDSAGSYDIARLVDNQISFLKDEKDFVLGLRRMIVTKIRDDGAIDMKVVTFEISDSLRMGSYDDASVPQSAAQRAERQSKERASVLYTIKVGPNE